ncbi:MAG: TonB-dependent receptor, partial [Gemmatimonadota bacterium]|nr:TonB-dependent receptor [Gemmatimonadota bacterium]
MNSDRVRSARRAALEIALGLLLSAGSLGAQATGTVTGRVTDVETGEPVASTTVRAVGTQSGTITRADGSYRVSLPAGSYELRATFIGYSAQQQRVVIAAGQTVTQDFSLRRTGLSLDQVIVTGSRRVDRTVVEAPVPIDVLSSEDIQRTGLTETSQIIQMLAPSFNFPRPSVNDGTDHVRPATLRSLGPDQVLVLINGKRRHNTALVHVNQSVGRGSTSVDFNAIPANAIERIEILRDGAAAQYGSDAIAGVINIILKSSTDASVSATVGQRFSNTFGSTTDANKVVTFGKRDFRDGRVLQLDGNIGWNLRETGFLHLGAEFRDRERTNRARADVTNQCLRGDVRCGNLTHIQSWQGDPETQDKLGFLNASLPLANGVELYSFGGISSREGLAAGFFRRSLDDRTVRAIAPNGFLPLIASDIFDGSAAIGAKGAIRGWAWDLSGLYGTNSFEFTVDSSLNTSLGPTSPTSFYAGAQRFNQITTNLDLVRAFDQWMPFPLNVAFGFEARRDNYKLEKGDENSYAEGTFRILDGPNAGQLAPPFAQVFPGFRPVDEADESRTNVGGYVDLEANLLRQLLVAVAARAENYSDFGSTVDGKLATRYEPFPGFALRAAAQTGFRAPSLAQSNFSAVSTNFILVNGVNTPFEIRTFAVGSPGATLLGAKELEPEESTNYSAGVTLRPFSNLSLTADYYRVEIDNRIVLSGNFIDASVRTLLEQNGIRGVNGARYFTNAIDTRTRGLDLVMQYGLNLAPRGLLRFTAGHNQNKTKVTRVAATPPQLAAVSTALFDRVQKALFESGQPRNNTSLTANYSLRAFGLNLHTQRFGKVTEFAPALTGAQDQTYSAKWITDLALSYRLFDRLALTLGGNNITDAYPDTTIAPLQTRGIYVYDASSSTFGINGAYYYVKASYDLGRIGRMGRGAARAVSERSPRAAGRSR